MSSAPVNASNVLVVLHCIILNCSHMSDVTANADRSAHLFPP